MATISDLVAKHSKVPGDIRIQHEDSNDWFQPFFFVQGSWFGRNSMDVAVSFYGDLHRWQLYTEPKKKVVRWLWAYVGSYGNWILSDHFYSEHEAVGRFAKGKKLEWSATEFEE